MQVASDLKIRQQTTGLGPSALNHLKSDVSYFKVSQISPTKRDGGETTNNRDLNPSELNANFTASLPRRYDGQSLILYNGAQGESPTKGGVMQAKSRDNLKASAREGPLDRSNSGNLTKRRAQKQMQSFDLSNHNQIRNRKNVLAKTKNQLIEMMSPTSNTLNEPELLRNSTIPESSIGNQASEVPKGSSASFPMIGGPNTNPIRFGEVGLAETIGTNSPIPEKS